MKFQMVSLVFLFALTGCIEREPLAQGSVSTRSESENEQVAYSKVSTNNYCFYRLENKDDWRDILISDQNTKNIAIYAKLYEENSVLLPPISFQGKVWLASGCDEHIVEEIFPRLQYDITSIRYTEYRDQLMRASTDYSIMEQ